MATISRAQMRMYRAEWGKVKKVLLARGFDAGDAEQMRHLIHEEELGADKSSTEFTQADLDAVLGGFDAILHPDDINRQLEARDGARRRMIYGIKHTGFPDAYVAAIARDKFDTDAWESLAHHQLRQLRMTLEYRLRARAKK